MPTIFSHPAAALGFAPWFRRMSWSLAALGAIATIIPDADVAAFSFGIPYARPLGHGGFTHSILFAVLLAAVLAFAYSRLTRLATFRKAAVFLFGCVASHGLLDAMTTGGKGVGFFIPFSNRRFFLPFRPIRVSPIGGHDFAAKAWSVLSSEALWVWLPFIAIAAAGWIRSRVADRGSRIAGRGSRST